VSWRSDGIKEDEVHAMNTQERLTVQAFHNLYYDGPEGETRIYDRTRWMNVPCEKCPLDLWIYQEIIAEVRPDLIVETGTRFGGSALFMAHMLDLVGAGEIISIDVDNSIVRPVHPRIRYVHGSSADPQLIASLLGARPARETRMVVLDSDHSKAHVLDELRLLAPYVSIGSYLIVEDTNVNGHPAFPTFGPGPYEAVEEFLKDHAEFTVDDTREKFLMTFNPRGYLRRTA
jgi:cephalosporin hydroxylase